MLLQSARNITIEVLCEGKSKWAHTHKNAHTKTSLCSWADSHWPHCSLSVNRCALCFLQQEPAAETCYCAMCRPEQNLTISQMLHEIGFYFFEEPPNTKKTKHILSLQFSQSQHIVNTFIGTFSVVQGLSKVQEIISGKTWQQCNYCMNCHDILYGHPWSQEDEAFWFRWFPDFVSSIPSMADDAEHYRWNSIHLHYIGLEAAISETTCVVKYPL